MILVTYRLYQLSVSVSVECRRTPSQSYPQCLQVESCHSASQARACMALSHLHPHTREKQHLLGTQTPSMKDWVVKDVTDQDSNFKSHLSTYCPSSKDLSSKAAKDVCSKVSADSIIIDIRVSRAQEHHHVVYVCTILRTDDWSYL